MSPSSLALLLASKVTTVNLLRSENSDILMNSRALWYTYYISCTMSPCLATLYVPYTCYRLYLFTLTSFGAMGVSEYPLHFSLHKNV